MSNYFIINFGEDGVSISLANKQDVQKFVDDRIKEDEPFVTKIEEFYINGNYPIYKTMIIKGELIIPKPIEIIKKYEIE